MKIIKFYVILTLLFLSSCKNHVINDKPDFVLAFGSCNKQHLQNNLWDDIVNQNPDVWVWGGDIVYSDTEDMTEMKNNYDMLKMDPGYQKLVNSMDVTGTWDDHDYGANDSGLEYPKKAQSQQLFLDFLDVRSGDARRSREGVYGVKDYHAGAHSVRIILLDTRYFRSHLTKSETENARYQPNPYGQGTMLGESQWQWLTKQLYDSKADFNIIVSSIQFLSNQHGFEKWGNMPHEVEKLEKIITQSGANNVIMLSGDRHISELSMKHIGQLNYPLIDFTSSGMTHSYGKAKDEINPYRQGPIITDKTFATLEFDFEGRKVVMKLMGDDGVVYLEHIQEY